MRQVVQNYANGELSVVEVPVPACKAGGVLVRTTYSLISTGTEMMKVHEAQLGFIGKARARPDQVRKVIATAQSQGLAATVEKVMGKLDAWTPLGYSLAGVVEEVGAGVEGIRVGDVVACAGNQFAVHAEYVWVPTHLCVVVPASVDPRHAAFSTVGAIAMQGLRQGEVQLGEVAVVIGLGLIGQLLTQLLVAAGARVVGIDVSDERCRLAEKLGATVAGPPEGEGFDALERSLAALSGGHGADLVFLAAGGPTNQPVEVAARLARDRGRVVDIGKCSLDLPWNAYYDKELDVRFSRSYGPGRYDDRYEVEGVDYPVGYVRWTEHRNLACFVDLLAQERLDLEPLVSHVAPFESATETYAALERGDIRGIGVLFAYPEAPVRARSVVRADAPVAVDPVRTALPRATPVAPPKGKAALVAQVTARLTGRSRPTAGAAVVHDPDAVRLAFVGAGAYASSMLLPHLAARADVRLVGVATTSSLSAADAQRRFGFEVATTDTDALLADPDLDAVVIATRHASHARLAAAALRAGKAVFVEKPLALDEAGLAEVLAAVDDSGNDRLHVGFNRRFSPVLVALADRRDRAKLRGPWQMRYTVNAGQLDASSWYSRRDAEGSRFAGEGGHFLDTLAWWAGADPVEVAAMASGVEDDDVAVTVRFADGSVGVVVYATGGSSKAPKESFAAIGGGAVARMDAFRTASLTTRRTWRTSVRGMDKGQAAQLDAFCHAVRTGGPMPVRLTSLVATTRATLAVGRSLAAGAPVTITP